MAGTAEDNQDQSMEEILQSIKRIIADEDDDTAPEAAQPAAYEAAEAPVLELTELVQEDGTVSHLNEAAPAGADSAVLDKAPEPAPAPPSPPPAAGPAPASSANHSQGLVSSEALNASTQALNSLRSAEKPKAQPKATAPSPAFRSGTTVEDLVIEALRPMLKEWLDANLPQLVESLVEKEVRRISGN